MRSDSPNHTHTFSDSFYFKGIVLQGQVKSPNWLLYAAHLKRMINGLFVYGRDVLREDWTGVPFPDANAISKWLYLAVTNGGGDDLLMTPRTKTLGCNNLMLFVCLILRVLLIRNPLLFCQLDDKLQLPILTVFERIDDEIGVRNDYHRDVGESDSVLTVQSTNDTVGSSDDVDALGERIDEVLSVLEHGSQQEIDRLKREIDKKDLIIKQLEERLSHREEKENRESNSQQTRSASTDEHSMEKANTDHTEEQVVNVALTEWFCSSTRENGIMTVNDGLACHDTSVECTDPLNATGLLQKEHQMVLAAWYNLGQEILKNNK